MYGQSTWNKVEVLVAGAILATGKRTVSGVWRVKGLSADRNYAQYHAVLSRAVWSGLEASAGGRLVCGLDETIQRRRGDKIKAKGR
jgi:hypothetical protein